MNFNNPQQISSMRLHDSSNDDANDVSLEDSDDLIEDDTEELDNVVVIRFSDENIFEIIHISDELEAEILAERDATAKQGNGPMMARKKPKWIKKVGNFLKKVLNKVQLCYSAESPVKVIPCRKP